MDNYPLLLFFIFLFICYLIGSFPTSILISHFLLNIDIREHGSHNAGATNVFRVLGWKPGMFVIIVDVFKGWLPTYLVADYFLSLLSENIFELGLIKILFGFSAVLGHSYTIFANFKGGKGVGTLLGMLIALFPIAIPLCMLIFLFSLIFTGYVSVGSILASIFLPISLITLPLAGVPPPSLSLIIFSLLIPFFVIFTHRSNISRLRAGNENKFEKVMVFKKIY
jgi:acyl phosphate:glycerol-3-phosphate acyltransferase